MLSSLNLMPTTTLAAPRREPIVLLGLVLLLMVALGISPKADRITWLLENIPVMVVAPLLVLTYGRFPLTPLAYRLIALHALILMVGGYYTYAEVPIGNWVEQAFNLSRNHYDRVGHFAQGFVPALIGREVLLRKTPLRPGVWLSAIVILMCLGISACYEFTEWWAALAGGAKADAFLGSQGDVWDTQWDMFMAFIGASTCMLTLSRRHDKELGEMGRQQ
jgi:putative membrane protein